MSLVSTMNPTAMKRFFCKSYGDTLVDTVTVLILYRVSTALQPDTQTEWLVSLFISESRFYDEPDGDGFVRVTPATHGYSINVIQGIYCSDTLS